MAKGEAVHIADECRADPDLWAECVVGASLQNHYIDLFTAAGFEDVTILREFDYFSGSTSENTRKVAQGFDAHSIELLMNKKGDQACIADES